MHLLFMKEIWIPVRPALLPPNMVEEMETLHEVPVCWDSKPTQLKSKRIDLGYSAKVRMTAVTVGSALDVQTPKTQMTLLQVLLARPSADDVCGARKRKHQHKP